MQESGWDRTCAEPAEREPRVGPDCAYVECEKVEQKSAEIAEHVNALREKRERSREEAADERDDDQEDAKQRCERKPYRRALPAAIHQRRCSGRDRYIPNAGVA